MADLADTLLGVPLFSGLTREDIAKVLGRLEEIKFRAGATIFSQRDAGDAFYLVQAGTVQVMIGNTGEHREIVAALGPGDWFGEMALLSGEPRAATVVALVDTVLWRLGRQAWDDLIEKHPSWLVQFCATLSKRLAQLDQQYSHSRGAFDTLATGYYESRAPEVQDFLRRASLMATIDPLMADGLLQVDGAEACLSDLKKNQPALIQSVKNDGVELHPFFREFLLKQLRATEGMETERALHVRIAAQYEAVGKW
jgi:CRP-like cAMP-binding protein